MEDRTHPEFQARHDMFMAECERRGWWIVVLSSTRSYEEQQHERMEYLRGDGAYAVPPDAPGAISPWGWQVIGSMHQVQADGYSHAKDYRRVVAPPWPEVHDLAFECGIGFYVPNEPWHGSAWSAQAGIFPVTFQPPLPLPPPPKPKDDEMATFVQADDGDLAVFVTDFVIKSWVADGNSIGELLAAGVVKAALDGTPIRLSRASIDSFPLVGPSPVYPDGYQGPRTTR